MKKVKLNRGLSGVDPDTGKSLRLGSGGVYDLSDSLADDIVKAGYGSIVEDDTDSRSTATNTKAENRKKRG